jgi:[acyl-carrier-protein] S-malonyltransferase
MEYDAANDYTPGRCRSPMLNLQDRLTNSAFVFRGYNVTNLGRSAELLEHRSYHAVVERCLRDASEIASEQLHRKIDLVDRVRNRQETDLETYADAVTLILAMEQAQLKLLDEFFGIEYAKVRLAFGYSLGEVGALVASGVMDLRSALCVPLAMSADCIELARDVTLGVLFSRGPALDADAVYKLCLRINSQGRGVIGISAFLAPNSLLLMGQANTIDHFADLMREWLPQKLYLRKNDSRWPPMHTPIVWQRNIPNRSAVMMQTLPGGFKAPTPAVLSLVTGKLSYNDFNARDLLNRWIDHPQRLWDAVSETLAMGIDTVVHVGPEPNLVPATIKRVADNVTTQLAAKSWEGVGLRAVSRAVRRPWLAKILPTRSSLLRAPFVRQLNLEDWLLEQEVQ